MNYFTISTNPDYITIVDINNNGRRCDITRSLFDNARPNKVNQLFSDLQIKSWMSPSILSALKNIILKEYPECNANWDAISFSTEMTFLNRDINSVYIKPHDQNKWNGRYTLG